MLATVVATALGTTNLHATDNMQPGATFTMYDPGGNLVPTGTGGADDTVTGSIGGGTWSVVSTTTFFGANWTAHSGTTFGPGTYNFDTKVPPPADGGIYTDVVVGPDQVGGHILFNWSVNPNIDVINVWDVACVPQATFLEC
ncbi:MAG: hypothetical protein JRG79_18235, partial [Deltaproteobacteria bacterium]|nr:hypothetical protein [Deltaproteobacteria bacterium]